MISKDNLIIASAPTEEEILKTELNFDDIEKEKVNNQNEGLDKLVIKKQNSANM